MNYNPGIIYLCRCIFNLFPISSRMCLTSGFKEKTTRFMAVVLHLASHLPAMCLTSVGRLLGLGCGPSQCYMGRWGAALGLVLGETSYNT